MLSLCNMCRDHAIYALEIIDINKLDELIHQFLDRTILAFLQDLVTRLADAQAAEHTAMPDLNVKFLTGHTRHRTPRILRHGHSAVLLVACEMDLIQLRRHGFNIRRDKG